MTTSRGGRPPVGPMISLRFPTDLTARLDAHAAATGTTRSDLLRRAAELLLERDYTMITATAAGDHQPETGQRVGIVRRIQVSPSTGTAEDWYIVPALQTTDGPLGPTYGHRDGHTVQVAGWGSGTVRDIYPHRDAPTYVVEPDA